MSNRNHAKRNNKPLNVFDALAQNAPKDRYIYAQNDSGDQVKIKSAVQIRTMSVAWGLPFDELMYSRFMMNFLGLQVMPWDDIICTSSTYLPDARNKIHFAFLDSDADWLMMLDSDVLPPPRTLEKLLAHKKSMVGGWYKRKRIGANNPVVYDYQGVGEDGKQNWLQRRAPGSGLEKVDGAGAGCWLMSKEVARAIGEKPYNMLRGGEDLDLCLKVHEAGFETWIDWNIECAHAGVFYV